MPDKEPMAGIIQIESQELDRLLPQGKYCGLVIQTTFSFKYIGG